MLYRDKLPEAAASGDLELVKRLLGLGEYIESRGPEPSINKPLSRERQATALYRAARTGSLDIAHFLICEGADVNTRPIEKKQKKSPILNVVFRKGNQDMARLLLEYGAKMDFQAGFDRDSALHVAVYQQKEDLVRLLLDFDAPMNVTNRYGETPLSIACRGSSAMIVKLLLVRGAQTDIISCGRGLFGAFCTKTALLVACERNDVHITDLLLRYGANPDQKNEIGKTPLHAVSQDGYTEIVKLLLKKGAKTDICSKDGSSVLHKACEYNRIEIASLLLQNGANPDARDNHGETPLCIASRNGKTKVAKLLLKRGAQTNIHTKEESTALSLACDLKRVDTVGLLLQHGANPDHKTGSGATILYQAAWRNYLELVECLLDYKTDVNLPNDVRKATDVRSLTSAGILHEVGGTALHAAAFQGHRVMVQTLIRAGADLEAKTKDGLTPVYLAAQRKQQIIVRVLLQNGAKISDEKDDSVLALLDGTSNQEVGENRDSIHGILGKLLFRTKREHISSKLNKN